MRLPGSRRRSRSGSAAHLIRRSPVALLSAGVILDRMSLDEHEMLLMLRKQVLLLEDQYEPLLKPARLGDPIEEAYKRLIWAIDERVLERIKRNIKIQRELNAKDPGLGEPWR